MAESFPRSHPPGRFTRFGWPVLLLLLAGGGAAVMLKFRVTPAEIPLRRDTPRVATMQVERQDIPVRIMTQGHVAARTETTLMSEVSGLVEFASPRLREGSFFREGDVLLRVDPTEYRAAMAEAGQRLAAADVVYQEEKARAGQARADWADRGGDEAGNLALRLPQLRRAETDLWAAEAAVAVARRNLEKTEIRAPYDGRVLERFVDVGQSLVARSSPVATIYATDVAEIRVTLPLSDLPFLGTTGPGEAEEAPPVLARVLRQDGSIISEWPGVVSRRSGAVERQTRQLPVIVTVDDPFGLSEAWAGRTPLLMGSFVEVEISGITILDAINVPRLAVRPGNTVYLLNDDNRLEIRPVSIRRRQGDTVLVDRGLEGGERIILTPLATVVEGMELRAAGEEVSGPGNPSRP